MGLEQAFSSSTCGRFKNHKVTGHTTGHRGIGWLENKSRYTARRFSNFDSEGMQDNYPENGFSQNGRCETVTRMLPNFVLIGFMGCGKSTIGRRLAGLTGHRFLDTDDAIVDAHHLSIPDIFSQLGEERFRDLEEKVIEDLVGVAGIVLSSGGGAILRESNRDALKKIGIVIWLDADPEILFERATRTSKRPLLNTEDPRKTFDSLLATRRQIYESLADVHFDSTHTEQDEVARKVLEEAMRFRSRRG